MAGSMSRAMSGTSVASSMASVPRMAMADVMTMPQYQGDEEEEHCSPRQVEEKHRVHLNATYLNRFPREKQPGPAWAAGPAPEGTEARQLTVTGCPILFHGSFKINPNCIDARGVGDLTSPVLP